MQLLATRALFESAPIGLRVPHTPRGEQQLCTALA
jgi:hypothetical protein